MESEWIDPYRVGVNEKKRKKKLSTPQQWWEPTEREREKERMGGCLEVEVGAEAQGVQVAVEFGQVGAQQDVVGVVEGGHARLVQPVEGVQQRPVQQVGEAHERVGRLQVQQQRRRHERHALSQQKKPKTTRWVRSRSYSVAVRKEKASRCVVATLRTRQHILGRILRPSSSSYAKNTAPKGAFMER